MMAIYVVEAFYGNGNGNGGEGKGVLLIWKMDGKKPLLISLCMILY